MYTVHSTVIRWLSIEWSIINLLCTIRRRIWSYKYYLCPFSMLMSSSSFVVVFNILSSLLMESPSLTLGDLIHSIPSNARSTSDCPTCPTTVANLSFLPNCDPTKSTVITVWRYCYMHCLANINVLIYCTWKWERKIAVQFSFIVKSFLIFPWMKYSSPVSNKILREKYNDSRRWICVKSNEKHFLAQQK